MLKRHVGQFLAHTHTHTHTREVLTMANMIPVCLESFQGLVLSNCPVFGAPPHSTLNWGAILSGLKDNSI